MWALCSKEKGIYNSSHASRVADSQKKAATHTHPTPDHPPLLALWITISVISYQLRILSTIHYVAPLVWFPSWPPAESSMISHLVVDSSTSSVAWFLSTSPSNKSPSTRPRVSRNHYAPSDVPSASKMKQRISEAFGSSKNIIYNDQDSDPGVPETSFPAQNNNPVDLQNIALGSLSLLAPPTLLSYSPRKCAVRRRGISSSLPSSSPPSSSGGDEIEGPAHLSLHGTRKSESEDLYGLLRGQEKFSQFRRRHRHRRQKNTVDARNTLGWLENLSPMTPCANSGISSGQTPYFSLLPHSSLQLTRRGHGDRNQPDGDGGRGGDGNMPDPDGSSGAGSDTLSDLLARLPRGRRPLQRQDSHGTSFSTTVEPPKTAGEKKRGQQRKKKRAGDEGSHLKGEDRVVRNAIYILTGI